MLDVKSVLRMLAEQVEETGLPVPAPERVVWEWAEGLGLPEDGEVLLFTGALYQLVPYIEEAVRQLERLESSRGAGRLLGVAGRLGGSRLARLVLRPPRERVEWSRRVLRSIVRLLRDAGYRVAYNPRVDAYSGILLYDMGLDSAFRRHAERVARKIMDSGARLVVTVDPHTTHALRTVYPEVLPWFRVEVKSYLELLDEAGYTAPGGQGDVTIHDPCLYARQEGVLEQPRRLLSRAGYRVVEARRSGRMTYCCGGPLESLAPRLSRRIAEARLAELVEASRRVVTMCPICYSNLSRANKGQAELVDVALLLWGSRQG